MSELAEPIESHRRGCSRFCKTLSFCRESHWEPLPDGTKRHLRCNCDGPHRAQWLLDLIRAAQGECFQGDWTPINDATKDFEGRPGKEGIPPEDPRCPAMTYGPNPPGTMRCEKPAGHEGWHAHAGASWGP